MKTIARGMDLYAIDEAGKRVEIPFRVVFIQDVAFALVNESSAVDKDYLGLSCSKIKQLQAQTYRIEEKNKKLLEIIKRYHDHCGNKKQICGLNYEAEQALLEEPTDGKKDK